jgi:hypothetical protein
MTTIVKKTPIHALHGLTKMLDGVVTPLLDSSLKGLLANPVIYAKPPVDLATYGTGISSYEASIPAALDGGKTAVAQKNKLRHAAIKMYDLLAHYVELNCNDDMATFLLSGFQAKPSTKNLTPPVSDSIRKVKQGAKSGEVDVTLLRFKGAASYELHWAPVPPGGAPTVWVSQPVTSIRPATTISALTPGTTYAFQVRALLKKGGYTDWSDSVTIMCT